MRRKLGMRRLGGALVVLLVCLPVWHARAGDLCSFDSVMTGVEMQIRHGTTEGTILLELCTGDLPVTANNFLAYVLSGAYTDSGYLHRSVDDPAVIQGGGFYIKDGLGSAEVEEMAPIPLEKPGFSNLRGTIAMARTQQLVSATSQWYINTEDNTFLDPNAGLTSGYQVFGRVISGMDVVDEIHALDRYAFNQGVLANVPVDDGFASDPGNPLDYLVYIEGITDVPEPSSAAGAAAAVATLAALAARRRRSALPSPA